MMGYQLQYLTFLTMNMSKLGFKTKWRMIFLSNSLILYIEREIAAIFIIESIINKLFLQLWQCHCRKWEEKKNSLRQWHCRNRGYKFLAIVVMALPKMGKKKGYEICERVKKKRLSCPQYFYNIFTINHT